MPCISTWQECFWTDELEPTIRQASSRRSRRGGSRRKASSGLHLASDMVDPAEHCAGHLRQSCYAYDETKARYTCSTLSGPVYFLGMTRCLRISPLKLSLAYYLMDFPALCNMHATYRNVLLFHTISPLSHAVVNVDYIV